MSACEYCGWEPHGDYVGHVCPHAPQAVEHLCAHGTNLDAAVCVTCLEADCTALRAELAAAQAEAAAMRKVVEAAADVSCCTYDYCDGEHLSALRKALAALDAAPGEDDK